MPSIISGTAGAERLRNWTTRNVTISADEGNDTIENDAGWYAVLKGGNGNDSIQNNYGYASTVLGGTGTDRIINHAGAYSCVMGGTGNDTIIMGGGSQGTTIDAGEGKNQVYLDYANYCIQLSEGEGQTTVYGFTDSDTLFVKDSPFVTVATGQDISVTADNASLLLKDSKGSKYSFIGTLKTGEANVVYNIRDDALINGSDAGDTIYNEGSNVRIFTGDGDDIISCKGSASGVTIIPGKGRDTVYAYNHGDSINYTFQYNNGDTEDVIFGYQLNDTIQILDAKPTIVAEGNDVVLQIGSGKITLKDWKKKKITYHSNFEVIKHTIVGG